MTTLTVSNTEHAIIEDCEVVESIKINVTLEMIEKILDIMPKKAKTLKTMPKTIKESIEKYGYKKVEQIALYMKKQKVEKVRVYFIKALENNWVDDIEENIDIKAPSIVNNNLKLNLESKHDEYDESLYIEFERFPDEIKNGIETYAYRDYIKKCGMETKIQQLAFMGSRNPEILGKPQKKQEEKEMLVDIKEVRVMIENAVELLDMTYNYSFEEKVAMLGKISKEVIGIFNKKELTKEKLNEIIDENMKVW